jgi:hypothetical protein
MVLSYLIPKEFPIILEEEQEKNEIQKNFRSSF